MFWIERLLCFGLNVCVIGRGAVCTMLVIRPFHPVLLLISSLHASAGSAVATAVLGRLAYAATRFMPALHIVLQAAG
jgi:hypothetical protein